MVPGALPEPQSCILTAAAAIISIADVMALAAAESFQKWTADPYSSLTGEDIRIRETDGKDWGENRLKTALAEGESAKIDLGKYTMAELGRGFQVQFYGEDEKPVNPNYDPDTATI